MAAAETKKAQEEETPAKDVAEEKAIVPVPSPEPSGGYSKALVVFEDVNKPPTENNTTRNSNERDIALAKLETEKRNSLIKAWEENEKTKAENKYVDIFYWQIAHSFYQEENEKTKAENKYALVTRNTSYQGAAKKISAILSWENTEKAVAEAQLRKKEEEVEKKKAEYAEKMKNKRAMIHRQAEEKRAMAMALRGEEVLKAEEMAAKYHATGMAQKKFLGCFGA